MPSAPCRPARFHPASRIKKVRWVLWAARACACPFFLRSRELESGNGARYGEPFVTREVAAVEDIVNMPVKSI